MYTVSPVYDDVHKMYIMSSNHYPRLLHYCPGVRLLLKSLSPWEILLMSVWPKQSRRLLLRKSKRLLLSVRLPSSKSAKKQQLQCQIIINPTLTLKPGREEIKQLDNSFMKNHLQRTPLPLRKRAAPPLLLPLLPLTPLPLWRAALPPPLPLPPAPVVKSAQLRRRFSHAVLLEPQKNPTMMDPTRTVWPIRNNLLPVFNPYIYIYICLLIINFKVIFNFSITSSARTHIVILYDTLHSSA